MSQVTHYQLFKLLRNFSLVRDLKESPWYDWKPKGSSMKRDINQSTAYAMID